MVVLVLTNELIPTGMIQEAVALFAPKGKGLISWVQIREHGKDVFHPARLPKDLSRKWKYIKSKSEASERCGGFQDLGFI
jgi:hypothetical protein